MSREYASEIPHEETTRESTAERPFDRIARRLQRMAEWENARFGRPLVQSDGRIAMSEFRISSGGPYKKEAEKEDEKFIWSKELEWSGLRDAKVREYYGRQYGIPLGELDEETATRQLLAKWEERQEQKNGPLAEQAITSLLHSELKEKFLVVRAAKYDDYAHGIDQILVNRATGDVICAFDEVSDEETGERAREKDAKVLSQAHHGGAQVKYGLTFRDGQLVKKTLEHIPTFRLAIAKAELLELVGQMSDDPEAPLTAVERRVFLRLLDSLDQQSQAVLAAEPSREVEKNLITFRAALEEMRGNPV